MNIESIVNLLFTEFVKKYGNIIEKDVVREFINRLDDLRELSEKYVMDFNLWA